MFSLLLGYLVWGKALMKSLVKCTLRHSRDSTPQRLHTHTHTSLTACECGTDSTLPRPLCANKKEFIQRPVADFYLFVTNRVSTHVLGMPWLLRTTRITSGRSATSPLHTWWFRRTAPVEVETRRQSYGSRWWWSWWSCCRSLRPPDSLST